MQILGPKPETLDQTLWGISHSGAGPSTNGPYRLRSLGLMVGLFWIKRETVFHSIHRKFPHESSIMPEAVSCILCSSRYSGWTRASFHKNSVGISCLDYLLVIQTGERMTGGERTLQNCSPPPHPVISVLLDCGLGTVGGVFLTAQFYHSTCLEVGVAGQQWGESDTGRRRAPTFAISTWGRLYCGRRKVTLLL